MPRMGSLDARESGSRRGNPQIAARHLRIAEQFWSKQYADKSRGVPLAVVKQRLLQTRDVDALPNALVAKLLWQADLNHDGYIDYEEYMNFAEASARETRARQAFNRAALSVVPRSERTAEKRSYLQQYSCWPPALFMLTAALLEIGVFVYYAVEMDEPVTSTGPAPIYSPLIYNPFRRYEAWRYVSYALIHSGYIHLTMNLVLQTVLGLLLELVHGWWRVGLIYLSGVLAGSLSQSLAMPTSYLAGASGGVYAVVYAHLGNLLLNWSEMEFRWLQLVICLVLSISDISFALWDTYGNPTPSNTGHMAHLGGAVAGVLVGIYVLRNLKQQKWERYCWWAALVLYVLLIGTGIVLNAALPVPGFFPPSE